MVMIKSGIKNDQLSMKNFFILAFILFQLNAFGQTPIPELWDVRVHDEAHVLSAQKLESLENQLKTFEDSTSNQIAILIISTLGDESLEEYSLHVAEKWKLGTKEKDNGVLLLIAVDDHKMRIETGQGLEGALPDAICSRIIRNEIVPYFKHDEFDTGVQAGIDAVIKAIGGEYKADGDSLSSTDLSIAERLLIGAFIFGILGVFTFLGLLVPGCGGWFLYVFLIPFYAIFPIVVMGVSGGIAVLIIYAVAFPILKVILGKTPWGKRMDEKMKNNSRRISGGGWSSGGFFGGGTSSGGWSSGSGGGFSGGGGSFGGGGSSGSW
jgi:uncharacterized protein